MKLTTRGDYATRIIMELSAAEGPAPLYVERTVIAGNVAARRGGGLAFSGGARPRLHHVTIASNAAALQERSEALDAARTAAERLYNRWTELEGKQTESAGQPQS